MSTLYLLVDDASRTYFDCEKMLLTGGEEAGQPDALHEQPFEQWLRAVNWGNEPPAKTDRYCLALPEARAVYAFLVASGWKARIVSEHAPDYMFIDEDCAGESVYRKVGTVWP